MASERQLRLAALLAEGRGGVEAMLEAGWPESTARWMGKDAARYLEEAGVPIPGKRAATVAASAVVEVEPVQAGDDHTTVTSRPARRKEK